MACSGMFSFHWPSVARHEKALSDKVNLLPPNGSVTRLPSFNKMKRKWEDDDPASPHFDLPSKKRMGETTSPIQTSTLDVQRPAPVVQAVGTEARNTMNQFEIATSRSGTGEAAAIPFNVQAPSRGEVSGGADLDFCGERLQRSHANLSNTNALRDAVEAQFGLEILLKHKELRLIDQEYAKCQTALEQLRRCQIIPYPAVSSSSEVLQAVNSGSGIPFNNHAPYAPPWGVMDGPYTRHYQRWLILDYLFDDTFIEDAQPSARAGKAVPERATRGSMFEMGTAAGKSRSQRGSNSARLKALPHGYPEPKEEKGPMIMKRGSDGKMVKLVCLDCRRSNFNSAQGFINHCRIAHSRQFQNHETAIEASGEELDVDAEGAMGEMNNTPQVTASSALVHPLIRSSAHLALTAPTQPSVSSPTKRKKSRMNTSAESQMPASICRAQQGTSPQSTKFANVVDIGTLTPSPQTPHLSALFARLGRGGDLDDMVNQAKAKPEIDLSLSSDDEDDDAMEVAAGTASTPQSRSTRGVLRDVHVPVRQNKSPGPIKQPLSQHALSNGSQKLAYLSNINIHQGYPSPYHSDYAQDDHSTLHPNGTPFNLSPNTTEAHTAPSLVSDDGDYGNTHSESESPSSAENDDDDDDHYIHAELMDHDDMDLGQGGSAAHHIGLGGKPHHAPVVHRRSSAMESPMSLHHEEQRHVSFAGPTRRQRRNLRTSKGK